MSKKEQKEVGEKESGWDINMSLIVKLKAMVFLSYSSINFILCMRFVRCQRCQRRFDRE